VIASITFAALHNSLRTFAAISSKRGANIVLGELDLLATNVPLVALMCLYLSARHGFSVVIK
jgi:hypothetical protein